MNIHAIIATIKDLNPDAIFYDNMDSALIGVGYIGHQDPVAVYSRAKIYDKLLADGLSQEDADEYVASKFVGQWVEFCTPVIVDDAPES